MWKEKTTFIGINIDDEKSWKKFSQKNIKWINLNDPKEAFGLYIRYKANSIPFYVLVRLMEEFLIFGTDIIKIASLRD